MLTIFQADVDYIFAVLGSDHPSIIEAYMRRQQRGKTKPKMLLFQHEVRLQFRCHSNLRLSIL
jgi:hypothetical protein